MGNHSSEIKTFNPIYTTGYVVSHNVCSLFFDFRTHHGDYVPRNGPFIIASNHASYLDPPLVGISLRRDVYYFARKSLPDIILDNLNCIPVDTDSDGDVSALKRVFVLLKEGKTVLVFPEGARSWDGKIQSAMRGVGMMACRAQVPVVPIRIFGSFLAWRRGRRLPKIPHRISTVWGKPLQPSEYDPGKEDVNRYQTASDRILRAIKEIELPREKVI